MSEILDVLAMVKDDLGIAADDTTHDAWLARRIDGIWSRMEAYTARTLAYPPLDFVDDWSGVIQLNAYKNLPPVLAYQPSATVYLRVFPVVAVSGIEMNGSASDPTKVRFDPVSGKLVSFDGTPAADIGPSLLGGGAKIIYRAGFSELPADLYELLVGALAPQWAARQAQGAGIPAGATSVNVQDVGSVEFGASANPFVASAAKMGADPLLGPYAANLDTYVDWRSMLGGLYPSTTLAPPAKRITEDGRDRLTEAGELRRIEPQESL